MLAGSKEAVNTLVQGRSRRCVFAADDSGRMLDRLAGLEKVISTEAVRQSLTATGRVGQRSCKLTHEIILCAVLAMGILTELADPAGFQTRSSFASR